MTYDDIRGSWWDDPDDICSDCGYAIEDCACWDDVDDFWDEYAKGKENEGIESGFTERCQMCGEKTLLNEHRLCSGCHAIGFS